MSDLHVVSSGKKSLARFVPAALGLLCATLLTITLVTCSGVGERMLSDWIPSDDYGERTYETYTLTSDDDREAPMLTVVPPSWVIGVATDGAPEDDPSASTAHLTYSFETGNVVLTYTTDDVDSFLAWQLNEDTIITDHIFGGRFTEIRIGDIRHEQIAGHDVVWGSYTYLNEYKRLCVSYIGATDVADNQTLNLTMNEEIRDEGTEPFLTDDVFHEVWESAVW
jgi:hypothetical protein